MTVLRNAHCYMARALSHVEHVPHSQHFTVLAFEALQGDSAIPHTCREDQRAHKREPARERSYQ